MRAPDTRPEPDVEPGNLPGPVNIASHLPRMAALQPDALALAVPTSGRRSRVLQYERLSFARLNSLSDQVAHGLVRHGIVRGTRTAMLVRPGVEFYALTFALFKIGAVPVLIDPGLGVRNLKKCLAEASPTAFVGVPEAHVARLLFGWARATVEHLVTVGRRGPWGGVTWRSLLRDTECLGEYRVADTREGEMAAILFTSGSTGPPKGAVYSHGNFAAQVAFIRRTYGIEPGEVDLPTFPLFGLFDPALGMAAVIPAMDFTRPARADPRRLVAAIEEFGVTNMFGSPALVDRFGRYGVENSTRLPTLRRVLSAGAPVSPKVLERFQRMLHHEAQIFTPYGATESLPVSSIGSHEVLGETRHDTDRGMGTCVGRPVDGVEVRIIEITDGPIRYETEAVEVASGDIGEIVVRGPNVTRSYFDRPDATELAKIVVNEADGSFFHRMGDLGYFDADGRLWFCGRKAHRVHDDVSGQTWFTIPCEGVFNAHPLVFRSALVGVRVAGRLEPIICLELEPEAGKRRGCEVPGELQRELIDLARRHAHTRAIRRFLRHPAFPVDIRHNAKIFREKLADWAAPRVGGGRSGGRS